MRGNLAPPRRWGRVCLLLFACALALLSLFGLLASCPWPELPILLVSVDMSPGSMARSSPTPSTALTKTPTSTSTPGASPTVTATPRGASTLTLLSPANAQGPVGANLTLSGRSWDAVSELPVKLSASATTCGSSGTALAQVTVDTNGTFTTTVVWPSSLASLGASYALCASTDSHTFVSAPQKYRVRAASAPSLALTLSPPAVGQETQIEGSNFVGASSAQITITSSSGHTRTLANVVPDLKDGSFIQSYTPAAGDLGSVILSAASAPDGNAPPALQASLSVQVATAALTTTSASPVPTTATSATATPISAPPGSSFAVVILVALASLLLALLLIGVAAWLLLSPRRPRVAARGRRARYPYAASDSDRAPGGFEPGGFETDGFETDGFETDGRSGSAPSGLWDFSASYPPEPPYAAPYPHDAPPLGPANRAPSTNTDEVSRLPTRIPARADHQQPETEHGLGAPTKTPEEARATVPRSRPSSVPGSPPGYFGLPSLDDDG
ncbi:MAG TPA: hypothetical protein VF120_02250 [Ktedonobacterales bacterium]